jgi:hypothetical protein
VGQGREVNVAKSKNGPETNLGFKFERGTLGAFRKYGSMRHFCELAAVVSTT